MYDKYVKRCLDFLFALILLLILWPIIAIVAILVRIKLGSPVIFTQDRPGKNEKIFKLYKFRGMTNEKDENGNLLPDEARLTSFGLKLRKTSLDELPELWNILKGDMSFVGPRPLLVQYLSLYNEEQRRRHDVRPGLTGLAQVHGRNLVSWQERFQYDVAYANHVTFLGDIKIIFKTIKMVFTAEGVTPQEGNIVSYFTGNEDNKEENQ